MPNITPNVEFDTLAREWRCKWVADDDKASLAACQDALSTVIASVSRHSTRQQGRTVQMVKTAEANSRSKKPSPHPDASSRERLGADSQTAGTGLL